jgi:hypothetical protein
MKRLGHELDEYMAVWGRFTSLLFAALFVLWHGAPAIKPASSGPACSSRCGSSRPWPVEALKLSPISMVTALWR